MQATGEESFQLSSSSSQGASAATTGLHLYGGDDSGMMRSSSSSSSFALLFPKMMFQNGDNSSSFRIHQLAVIFLTVATLSMFLDVGAKSQVTQMNNATQQALALDRDAIRMIHRARIHEIRARSDAIRGAKDEQLAMMEWNASLADEANATSLTNQAKELEGEAKSLQHRAKNDVLDAERDESAIAKAVKEARNQSHITQAIDGAVQEEEHHCGWLRVVCEMVGHVTEVREEASLGFNIANDDYRKALAAEEDRAQKYKEASMLEAEADHDYELANELVEEADFLNNRSINERTAAIWEWARGRQEERRAGLEHMISKAEAARSRRDVDRAILYLDEAEVHARNAYLLASMTVVLVLCASTLLVLPFALPYVLSKTQQFHKVLEGAIDHNDPRHWFTVSCWIQHVLIFWLVLGGGASFEETMNSSTLAKGALTVWFGMQAAACESFLLKSLPHYMTLRQQGGGTVGVHSFQVIGRHWLGHILILTGIHLLEFIALWVLCGTFITSFLLPVVSAWFFRLLAVSSVICHLYYFEWQQKLTPTVGTSSATTASTSFQADYASSAATTAFGFGSIDHYPSENESASSTFPSYSFSSSTETNPFFNIRLDQRFRSNSPFSPAVDVSRFLVNVGEATSALLWKTFLAWIACLMAILRNGMVICWQLHHIQSASIDILLVVVLSLAFVWFLRRRRFSNEMQQINSIAGSSSQDHAAGGGASASWGEWTVLVDEKSAFRDKLSSHRTASYEMVADV